MEVPHTVHLVKNHVLQFLVEYGTREDVRIKRGSAAVEFGDRKAIYLEDANFKQKCRGQTCTTHPLVPL